MDEVAVWIFIPESPGHYNVSCLIKADLTKQYFTSIETKFSPEFSIWAAFRRLNAFICFDSIILTIDKRLQGFFSSISWKITSSFYQLLFCLRRFWWRELLEFKVSFSNQLRRKIRLDLDLWFFYYHHCTRHARDSGQSDSLHWHNVQLWNLHGIVWGSIERACWWTLQVVNPFLTFVIEFVRWRVFYVATPKLVVLAGICKNEK